MRGYFTILLLSALPVFAADKSPFVGKWVLDKSQGQAADQAPDGLTQNIKQKGNDLLIQSIWKEPKDGVYRMTLVGVTTTDLKLPLDGSEVDNQIGPYAMKLKTQQEGNKLTTQWSSAMKETKGQGQWVRTVSDDGKQMTLEITGVSPTGQPSNAKLVFKRK